MKPMNVFLGACLSVLLLLGMAAEIGAQQPPAPADATKTDSAPATPSGEDKSAPAPPAPPAAQSPGAQTSPPSVTIDRQVETRTERVEREPARFLGLDPTIAAILGAVLVVVVVLGLVAMSRREDPHHTRA